MKKGETNKILIIRLSALGDTIHTLPLAYALRKRYPEAQIDWVVEDKAEKFIKNNPILNRVYVIKRKGLDKRQTYGSFKETVNEIRKEYYDIIIDTQQLFKSGIIMFLARGRRKITLSGGREFSGIFANEIIKTNRKAFDINYHVVKRNLEIAKYLDCDTDEIKFPIPDFESEISPEIKSAFEKMNKSLKRIVIAPATTWQNKHWTVEGWQYVINEIGNNCNVILTASEKEKPLVERILSGVTAENIIDLSGKTTLSDLTYIYKNSDLVVSPDSGSAHTAWVSGAKTLTLFFVTSANRTSPFGEGHYSISTAAKCAPCMKKHCRLKTNKNCCVSQINPKDIVNIIKKVL